MTEGPYYIVEEGTNRRTFKHIYDTIEIAQRAIDRYAEILTSLESENRVKHVPISVTEYNEKYAKLMGIKED